MARSKDTKTHSIFLIDKGKLLEMNGPISQPVETMLATLMGADEKYRLQKLRTDISTRDFSVCLYFRGDDNFQSKFASFKSEAKRS